MRPCRLLHAETLMKAKMTARADRHPIAICQQKIKKNIFSGIHTEGVSLCSK